MKLLIIDFKRNQWKYDEDYLEEDLSILSEEVRTNEYLVFNLDGDKPVRVNADDYESWNNI